MVRWILRWLFVLPLLLAPAAFAQDSGTPDEAKAMAVRAAELLGPRVRKPPFRNSIRVPRTMTGIFT